MSFFILILGFKKIGTQIAICLVGQKQTPYRVIKYARPGLGRAFFW